MSDGDDKSAERTEAPETRWLTPGVSAVAAASFFSDSGHEVTTSVLPAFLTGTLGASPAALGVIDGISDALIGVMKLIGGPLANDPHRRAGTASGGYLGTAVATGAIGAAVNRVAGRCAPCDRLVVPGAAFPGPRCVTRFFEPDISPGQGVWAGTGRRQPGRGRGPVAGGRFGDLGRRPAGTVSGCDSRFVRGYRNHPGRARISAQRPDRCPVPGASAGATSIARCRNAPRVGAGAALRIR